ncbi:DUF6518 family protein [Streptomyces aurantiogriseus]|uniref:Uncharacterized protein n=1 Tax=Streptomyces aurantiogriseus TaxID=66870 RepID=A0A918FJ83_9ACTN|nr:DUF6518 family protein [Streptomyces aurantiogriseus]GGR41986.1 hypothetical protein GCM10010251_68620 [Streptomyces aurantiogriseus]
MATATASRRDTPVTVLASSVAFGLLLGWATYGLHGTTPLLERATNSVSTWIIWTAVAGALIRARTLAVCGGALMMLATCGGYYTASTLGDTFGAAGLGAAAVWSVTGLAGGPLLAWAGWTVRRGRGDVRAVAGAVIAMVVLGEALWLGLALRHWGEAAAFLAAGALLTAVLTVYLARAGVHRYWLCAVLAPVGGLAFYLAEEGILDGLLGSV